MLSKIRSICLFIIFIAAASCTKNEYVYVQNSSKEKISTNRVGEILTSPFNMAGYASPGTLQVFNNNGDLLREKSIPTSALNFQRWKINNAIRYTYIEYDAQVYKISGVGYVAGSAVVLDSAFNEINRFRLLPYNGRTSASVDALDAHDFILIDDTHYIAIAYYETSVNNIPASLNPSNDIKVVSPIIQEVQNGNVIWEWQGSDYPEFYTTSVEGNAFGNSAQTADYMHLNSIFIDTKDNNLICSFRNLDQVIKINRKTGEIIWRLGGKNSDFPMTQGQEFLRQHHATLTDNGQILLLVDNGDATLRPYSRILEFQLNEISKTISSYKSYNLPNNLFMQYMGSVQKTNNTYFIGCGSVARYLEVNYKTGQILVDKTLSNTSYRALRY